jgi:hypothetical protein
LTLEAGRTSSTVGVAVVSEPRVAPLVVL